MGLAKDGICAFGWKARDFALKGTDGKIYGLADVRGPKGTLVVFICNLDGMFDQVEGLME
jgi:hypothetical protein